jgi:LmbE family N-acetylglucosaminyl deacetylase
MHRLIAVSPHFDDVCFSVGHLLRRMTVAEKILLNIFTRSDDVSNIPTIDRLAEVKGRQRIDAISRMRDEEDDAYARALGFRKIDLGFDDADIVAGTEKDPGHYYGGIEQETIAVTDRMSQVLGELLPNGSDKVVFCPLAIGQHRNHLVAFSAVIACIKPPDVPVVFYEDLPYAATPSARRTRLAELAPFLTEYGYTRHPIAITPAELAAKHADARNYASQMSDSNEHFVMRTPDCPAMHEAIWVQDAQLLTRLLG